MNRLDAPAYLDDHAAIEALAENDRLNSHPRLKRHLQRLKKAYDQYQAVGGDAFSVSDVAIPKIVAKFLRGHYASPPSELAFIKRMRDDHQVRTCPMCGSLHSGTLDHLLPKADHPAFSVYGPNLVPACKCNSLRSMLLVGPGAGERVLHPYFDAVLRERIIAAQFEDLGPVPRISTRMVLDAANPQYAAAAFHYERVVRRTGIRSYLTDRWAAMMLRPGAVIGGLHDDPVDRAALVTMLERTLVDQDVLRGSRNNWDSVFAAGLLDADVVDWLLASLRSPGRLPGDPLGF